jgi:hypothetical protein
MTRIMRDSTTPAAIPVAGTQLAAGYVDGSWDDFAAIQARFPGIAHVSIDVNGSHPEADVRDWENGDKAGSLEQWVIDHNNHAGHKDARVYCNRSTIPEVRQLTGSQILGKDYWLWVATLDGTKILPDMFGVSAVQDKGANLTGANYDESIVYDDTWKSSAPPAPSPAPQRDYVVVSLPDGASFKAVSGMVLK